jgi:hypothetical protein
MIFTMKFMQGNWCKDYEITYEWVKGHADRGNEEQSKEEQLNIEADALCNIIRNEETVPLSTQGNCALKEYEVCALIIIGTKRTSNMKGQLQSQVHKHGQTKNSRDSTGPAMALHSGAWEGVDKRQSQRNVTNYGTQVKNTINIMEKT